MTSRFTYPKVVHFHPSPHFTCILIILKSKNGEVVEHRIGSFLHFLRTPPVAQKLLKLSIAHCFFLRVRVLQSGYLRKGF